MPMCAIYASNHSILNARSIDIIGKTFLIQSNMCCFSLRRMLKKENQQLKGLRFLLFKTMPQKAGALTKVTVQAQVTKYRTNE